MKTKHNMGVVERNRLTGIADPALKRAALAKKVCAFCGHSFAKHRGDKCFGEVFLGEPCLCDKFEKKIGDVL